jgi:hypothetical protein
MSKVEEHLQNLKERHAKLNPSNDKKEIAYLANLRQLIIELEELIKLKKQFK